MHYTFNRFCTGFVLYCIFSVRSLLQTKDRGLTIIVTGRVSAVVSARREILTKLQTQVRGGGEGGEGGRDGREGGGGSKGVWVGGREGGRECGRKEVRECG